MRAAATAPPDRLVAAVEAVGQGAARVVLALDRLEDVLGRPLRNSVTDRWPDYHDTDFAALQRAYEAIRAQAE